MSEYGYIRQLNKRKNEGPKPRPGETVIDVDRNNRVLGNPFPLEDKDDEVARARVIGLYNEKLEADFAIGGPMFTAVKAIARRVIAGEKIGLNCWCVPVPVIRTSSQRKLWRWFKRCSLTIRSSETIPRRHPLRSWPSLSSDNLRS
jgi:hypothetical protein